MFVKAEVADNPDPSLTKVSLRCPACRQIGTLNGFPGAHDIRVPNARAILGQRACPNPDCKTHVFVVVREGRIAISYPAQRLDFDTTDIPNAVVASLEEALTCHAQGCYVACAIMVRKTLEDICRERGSEGANLKARLRNLGGKVVLPQELLDALDDLRLLGNDAAHVESETFSQVGQAEVEVALAVTREVVKGVYQYASLLKQLRSLKKSPAPA